MTGADANIEICSVEGQKVVLGTQIILSCSVKLHDINMSLHLSGL